jgi:hypothetical protein
MPWSPSVFLQDTEHVHDTGELNQPSASANQEHQHDLPEYRQCLECV